MTALPSELKSADALYTFLGIETAERKFLRRYAAYRYSEISIPKRRGGKRTLLAPGDRLKYLQRQLLKSLCKIQSVRAPVHGFVKGRSAITNASAHQTRPFLLNIDLRNYFGTITRGRVKGMLETIGLEEKVADAVCSICTTRNQLPQGAPTSPLLSNMIAFRLDRELMAFAKTHRLRYTRYADDISLSSYTQPTVLFDGGLPPPGRIAASQLSTDLSAIILSHGFGIADEKIWFSGPASRKEVTGLIVNEFTNVKRQFVRNVRASLFKVVKLGLSAAEAEYRKKYKTKASLERVVRGHLEWIAQVRGRSFSAYRTLALKFNRLFPAPALPISPTYDEIAERSVWVIEFGKGTVCEQGTAFFLEGVGLVTANHVLAELPEGDYADLFRPSDPTKKFKAKPSKRRCPHRDLVIVDHDIPSSHHLELSLATSPQRTRDDIIALGFPDYGPGDELSFRSGRIIGRATKSGVKLIEVSATISGGISGGPVINDRYQVVAIAHRGGSAENRQLAVDVSELIKLAKE